MPMLRFKVSYEKPCGEISSSDVFAMSKEDAESGVSITKGVKILSSELITENADNNAFIADNELEIFQSSTLIALRTAIQDAETYGIVRTEDGQAITGAMFSGNGIVLTHN